MNATEMCAEDWIAITTSLRMAADQLYELAESDIMTDEYRIKFKERADRCMRIYQSYQSDRKEMYLS